MSAVLEHAQLSVRPGAEAAFLDAFAQARPLITGQPGFRSLRLSRCVERPSEFLLLVEWDSVAAHEEGFRRSPEYPRWRELLHHFYQPFPVVEHYLDALPSA
ncbi:antibiotic biosynthesis monooxygenase [Crossiella sp. SN42]|uniref:antibiotic biosynthesis monooxygenase family protein n=1 Tax=Crossiella sp. SN42 TaxID=2944808 RepID=UPI00207CD21E|nr:antibiotic biosynthesis monooxygenase [Crossiella sp. SN42]MCO1574952.1 antibiotic biosynthesis monooxygenase [Crossiella sp. SN42]